MNESPYYGTCLDLISSLPQGGKKKIRKNKSQKSEFDSSVVINYGHSIVSLDVHTDFIFVNNPLIQRDFYYLFLILLSILLRNNNLMIMGKLLSVIKKFKEIFNSHSPVLGERDEGKSNNFGCEFIISLIATLALNKILFFYYC